MRRLYRNLFLLLAMLAEFKAQLKFGGWTGGAEVVYIVICAVLAVTFYCLFLYIRRSEVRTPAEVEREKARAARPGLGDWV